MEAYRSRVLALGLRDFSVSCIGLFLVMSFSTSLSLFMSTESLGVLGESGSTLAAFSSGTRIIVFLFLALISGTMGPLKDKKYLVLSATFAMTLSVILVAFAYYLPVGEASFSLALLSRCLASAGVAVLHLVWLEFYARMDLFHVLLYFSLAHLCSALLSLFLSLVVVGGAILAILAIIPLVSTFCLYRGIKRTERSSYVQGEAQSSDWSIPVRPILLLMAFGFANNFIRFFLTVEDKGTVLLGVCAAALFVLALLLFRFNKLELKTLYQVAVPLMIAGAMCAIIAVPWLEVTGAFFSNAAYTLFSIFITAIFCSLSYRYGINAVWLFGFAHAGLSTGSMMANITGEVFGPTLTSSNNLMIALSVLVVAFICLSMTLVSDKDFSTTWGITHQGKETGVETLDAQKERLLQCSSIARRYGLTRREEEILVLLIQGDTLSSIGEKLFIADSTMKTHSRHIYRKLNVANRQELQEFVEDKA